MDILASYRACTLCPRHCGADRTQGALGACGMTDVLRVAKAYPHRWEEPCLSGERGSGCIFFSGCALSCVYCQNREISHGGFGREITLDRLIEICLELEALGVHNINWVTPTHYVPHIVKAMERLRGRGFSLPFVYNTSGYEKTETLQMLDGLIDIYLPDDKYGDAETAARYSACADYPETALRAIGEMVRQCGGRLSFAEDGMLLRGVVVRHLVLPSHYHNSRLAVKRLYEAFGDRIYLSLMRQYTPMPELSAYPELQRKLRRSEYERIVNYALRLGVTQGFFQESGADKSSFIPDFDLLGT